MSNFVQVAGLLFNTLLVVLSHGTPQATASKSSPLNQSLWSAVKRYDTRSVHRLLARGADANTPNSNHLAPLGYLLTNDKVFLGGVDKVRPEPYNIIRDLVQHGAKVDILD